VKELPDERLIESYRDPRASEDQKTQAYEELEARYLKKLLGRLFQVSNRNLLLRAIGCDSLEGLVSEIFQKAIAAYQGGRGASFGTFLYTVFGNRISDAGRKAKQKLHRAKTLVEKVDEEDRGRGEVIQAPADPHLGLQPEARMMLDEVRAVASKCLRALDPRTRMVLVLRGSNEIGPEEVHELLPEIATNTISQITTRGTAAFYQEWIKSYPQGIEKLLKMFLDDMGRNRDVKKIKDPEALQALEAWEKNDKDLSAAAKAIGQKEERTRHLLLEAHRDMHSDVFRRGKVQPAALARCEGSLADYLALAEGTDHQDPLLQEIDRVMLLVRAAFGFIPLEDAIDTLGSFLQGRLEGTADYRRACKELDLTPTALRRLLANEIDPDDGLYARIARFLEVPEKRLRRLPRVPLEHDGARFRGSAGFDHTLYRARVSEWLLK